MSAFDDDVHPMEDPAETPRGGGRGLTLALLIAIVVCAFLAVGAVLYAQSRSPRSCRPTTRRNATINS